MTAFKTPTAADFAKLAELDNLTDADLLAPIGTGDTAVDSMLSVAPARALKAVPAQPAPPVPELAYLLAQAQAVLDCTLSSELPPRVVYAAGRAASGTTTGSGLTAASLFGLGLKPKIIISKRVGPSLSRRRFPPMHLPERSLTRGLRCAFTY